MLKIGLIVNEGGANDAVHGLIEDIASDRNCTLALITVVHPSGRIQLKQHARRLLWRAISKIDAFPLRLSRKFRQFHTAHLYAKYNTPLLHIRPVRTKGGDLLQLSSADREAVRRHGSDILLWLAAEPPGAGMASLSRLGMLSIGSAGITDHAGTPSGLREALNKAKGTSLAILHQANGESGYRVLVSGRIPTAPLFSINAASIQLKACGFLHKLLKAAAATGMLPDQHVENSLKAWHGGIPDIAVQLRYLFTRSIPGASHMLFRRTVGRHLMKRAPRWNVAFQHTDEWRNIEPAESTTIKNPARHYLADPVVWKENGQTICFVEDFDYGTMQGTIAAYELLADGYENLGAVLTEPFHLSFPFIFRWNGELYMCPDTNAAGEIRLYRCRQFPTRWAYHRTLMRDVSAADTLIFEHAGRWWMLTNMDSSRLGERCSELHCYHADTPDSTDWTPHGGNPVVFDSECARNGGFFREGERLFRAFQVHGFDRYGEALGVAEINRLDESGYEEKVVKTITPDRFPGSLGIHTLSFRDGVLAVDYLRNETLGG